MLAAILIYSIGVFSSCSSDDDNNSAQLSDASKEIINKYQDKPFGFCTMASRTEANKTYDITGGGCYTYPVKEGVTGVVILKSNGQDMKSTIEETINDDANKIIIFDGSDGKFIVSGNVKITASNKTLLGINNASICTQWYLTDDIKKALDDAGVPQMNTSDGGGELPNGTAVKEKAEYNTRLILIEMTGDSKEDYRKAGIFTLNKCQNIIIRNLKLVGPGAVDVGGNDLVSCTGAVNCWIDHCEFTDGLDGNCDITKSSNFITVSWCTFNYTSRSYMHKNSNLIGSSDSEATGFLNTTFAYNWWGTDCQQRMPMGRVGKIHVLNNYFSSIKPSNCINPRKNAEFLIEGNYFDKGITTYYSQRDAVSVTWKPNNYIAESDTLPSSFGTAVSVPYTYITAPASDVPTMVRRHAGATLFR